MYISKLHLQGFKSFFSKTDLSFGEGITAVVGPNGCGKSNIVDAIRWVLGEQKISVLRSAKKEDVIFNGSKNRKPLGFCEVTMLIHNNRDILPLEYNDVEIIRRLYRSGESEFYINKTACRLKDIHNLFVDTGMSSNAYSVIELKMVDSILSNNANDRRHMFEEAAGINNYKQQRQAAIRKMDATRLDMERVNDIIIEINNTVRNLGLQMKRYERHKKLIRDLEEVEIQTARGEIQLILKKQIPIDENLSELKGQYSSLSGQMNLDETMVDKVERRFQKQKEKFDVIQSEQSQLENKIVDLNSKRLVWSEKITGNNSQKLHFQDELNHSVENIAVTKKKIEELKQLNKELDPELISRKEEFKKTERNCFQISKKFENLQIDHQEMKKQSESKFLKIRKEEASIELLQSTILVKEEHLKILHERTVKILIKKEHSQADLNILSNEVKKYERTNAKLTAELERKKKEQAKEEDRILKVKNSLTDYYARKSSLEAKLQFYGNVIDTHEGRPEGIKAILYDKKKYPYVLGVLSDLIQIKDPYQTAVESVLGEFNYYLVVATKDNAHKLIKDSNQRLSVIALDSVDKILPNNRHYPAKTLISTIKYNKQLDCILRILMGDVCILPKDQKQPYFEKVDEFSWVSETGSYFKRGYIFKSSGKESPSIIGRHQKMKEMVKEMESLNKEIDKIKNILEKNIKRAKCVQKKLQLKVDELDLNIKILNSTKQKLARKDYIFIQQQEHMGEVKEEIKRMETQIIDMNIRSKSIRKNVNVFRKEFDKFISTQDAFREKIDKLRSKRNGLQQSVQDTRIKLMEIEKEKEGLGYRINTFKVQEERLDARIIKYESDHNKLEEENKRLTVSISVSKNNLKKISKKMEVASLEKNKNEFEYNKTYLELQQLQSGIRERQKRKDEFLDSIREYELELAEGENDIKQQRQRIMDLYHKKLPDAPLNLHGFDLSSNKLQIDRINRSLERMGPVNMAVADEYEQESERYDFMTQQFTDLEESEKSLKISIDKLDGEAKTKFIKTFDSIKENFNQTFVSFFDGGEGHLRLVCEDDPLETDIEIIARPPGKKRQPLRMLSAGEKALTAIALLFAIYLVKPSPFCILDEVDAPLDDSNINKFTKVLREFSNRTQFIVVTHNKLTMGKADYMYGITQQEEGVSKIVSVKLKAGEMEAEIA